MRENRDKREAARPVLGACCCEVFEGVALVAAVDGAGTVVVDAVLSGMFGAMVARLRWTTSCRFRES